MSVTLRTPRPKHTGGSHAHDHLIYHDGSTTTRSAARPRMVLLPPAPALLLLALIVILTMTGAAFQAIMERGDAWHYPPPGRLVDVGSYRLHLHCVGAGSPTVVLVTGVGGSSLHWSAVQPRIPPPGCVPTTAPGSAGAMPTHARVLRPRSPMSCSRC